MMPFQTGQGIAKSHPWILLFFTMTHHGPRTEIQVPNPTPPAEILYRKSLSFFHLSCGSSWKLPLQISAVANMQQSEGKFMRCDSSETYQIMCQDHYLGSIHNPIKNVGQNSPIQYFLTADIDELLEILCTSCRSWMWQLCIFFTNWVSVMKSWGQTDLDNTATTRKLHTHLHRMQYLLLGCAGGSGAQPSALCKLEHCAQGRGPVSDPTSMYLS